MSLSKGIRFLILAILSCTTLSACIHAPDQSNIKNIPAQEIRIHRVNFPNENLSMISLWYTGNAKNWYILRTYNGHLRSASNLSTGNVIRIPSDIMIRMDEMPAGFVAEQRAKLKRVKKKPTSSTPVKSKQQTSESPDLPAPSSSMDSEILPDEEFEDAEGASQDQLIENLLSK